MRIAVIQDFLRRGGTERQSLLLCREFRKLGATPVLISIRPGGPLSGEAAQAGIEHRSVMRLDTRLDFFAPGLSRAVARAEPDVVICMGRVANGFANHLQRSNPGALVVGTVRTGKPVTWDNWRSFRRLPLVISNTQWWRRELQRRGLEREKLAVIPNGLTFSWSWPDVRRLRAGVRDRLGLEPDQCLLLNVAGFRPGKRQEHLIRLLAKMPAAIPWRAVMVGDGERLANAQQLAQELGLSDRITFTGALEDPGPFYAAADIAVSVSQEDALPNFLVEAQVAALPVLATDFQGVGEAFKDKESGYLVEPDDQSEFMARLQELIELPAKRKALGASGREWAQEQFDPTNSARRHLELLRQHLAARA